MAGTCGRGDGIRRRGLSTTSGFSTRTTRGPFMTAGCGTTCGPAGLIGSGGFSGFFFAFSLGLSAGGLAPEGSGFSAAGSAGASGASATGLATGAGASAAAASAAAAEGASATGAPGVSAGRGSSAGGSTFFRRRRTFLASACAFRRSTCSVVSTALPLAWASLNHSQIVSARPADTVDM